MAAVFWFTGLSGAGKSTIARIFYSELKNFHPSIYLDGDELRQALGVESSFSLEERRALAFQYARLCLLFVKQEVHVVCATVSMFEEVRVWNRQAIPDYCEIYVKAPLLVLMQRKESVYTSSQSNPIVGLDLPFEEPKNPDIILDNGGLITPGEQVDYLKKRLDHVFSNKVSNSTSIN